MKPEEVEKIKKLRGKRWYNGLPSKLMNDIYDGLIARDENLIEHKWWAVFSLYLARVCNVLEKEYIHKSQITIDEREVEKALKNKRIYIEKTMQSRLGGYIKKDSLAEIITALKKADIIKIKEKK